MKIKSAKARVVLNSRADPTIEIEINGYHESAPEGASKGKHEAPYLDPNKAAYLFNKELAEVFKTFDIQSLDDLRTLEEYFFNMGGFEKYGANTLIAAEYAILRAWSGYTGAPIYEFFKAKPKDVRILSNIVGGGAHALWRGSDIQEFLVSPKADTKLSIFLNAMLHKIVGEKLATIDNGFLGAKNDEGAWVSSLNTESILVVISEAIEALNQIENIKIEIGLDIAASQLYDALEGVYIYKRDKLRLSREEQIRRVLELIDMFKLFYIEDPLHEEDFEGFAELNKKTSAMITGDDLTVTNLDRLKKAIKHNSIKAIIIKPNQAGSIVRAYEVTQYAKKHGIVTVMSHRSGETESNILAHLAIGFQTDFVKFGIANGERIAKLNELLRLFEF